MDSIIDDQLKVDAGANNDAKVETDEQQSQSTSKAIEQKTKSNDFFGFFKRKFSTEVTQAIDVASSIFLANMEKNEELFMKSCSTFDKQVRERMTLSVREMQIFRDYVSHSEKQKLYKVGIDLKTPSFSPCRTAKTPWQALNCV